MSVFPEIFRTLRNQVVDLNFCLINSYSRFVYLIGIHMTSGLVWGFLNVASMQIILTIWDAAKSRPIVQISLMIFSLGALTTSTSCRSFLSKSPTEIMCETVHESVELDSFHLKPNVSVVVETNLTDLPFYQHAEFWPYTINALMHVVFGVILLASTAFNKSEKQSSIIGKRRPEKGIREIWVYGEPNCQNTEGLEILQRKRGKK